MYAVIHTGGKQYRVAQGSRLRVEKIAADANTTIELDQVLMVASGEQIAVGTPYIEGGKVTATIKEHGRAKKVKIIKFKRRKHHMKHQGHRQSYTLLEVTGINAAGMMTPSIVTEVVSDTTITATDAANAVLDSASEATAVNTPDAAANINVVT